MITAKCNFITVIDVMREMGVEPTDKLDWAVGLTMAKWYIQLTGFDPPKHNAPKTFKPDEVHAFAHYPECFRKRIQDFIRMHKFELERQGWLFQDPPLDPPTPD